MALTQSSDDASIDKVVQKFWEWLNASSEYYRVHMASSVTGSVQMRNKLADYLDKMSQELRVDDPAHKGKSFGQSGKQSSQEPSSVKASKSAPTDNDCRICFESVAEQRLAILEQCDHKYCEPCMRSWALQNPNQPVKCPTCRTVSERVIFRKAQFRLSGPEKLVEFDSMLCCRSHTSEIGRRQVPEEVNDTFPFEEPFVVDDDPNDPDFVVPDNQTDDTDELLIMDEIFAPDVRANDSPTEEEGEIDDTMYDPDYVPENLDEDDD